MLHLLNLKRIQTFKSNKITVTLYAPTHKMVKHTQIITRQQSMNCLSVSDHFARLALKGTCIQIELQPISRLCSIYIYHLKKLKNLWFLVDVFRGYRKGSLARSGLSRFLQMLPFISIYSSWKRRHWHKIAKVYSGPFTLDEAFCR